MWLKELYYSTKRSSSHWQCVAMVLEIAGQVATRPTGQLIVSHAVRAFESSG